MRNPREEDGRHDDGAHRRWAQACDARVSGHGSNDAADEHPARGSEKPEQAAKDSPHHADMQTTDGENMKGATVAEILNHRRGAPWALTQYHGAYELSWMGHRHLSRRSCFGVWTGASLPSCARADEQD